MRLRPETAEDEGFLCRLYASTRAGEMAAVPWPEGAKQAFLADQFRLQRAHYRTHYEGAEFLIIEIGAEPAGRLYLHRTPGEVRVMDIALTPEWRGRGIGGSLLRSILEEAGRAGAAVTCHVEFNNPARRLYERLGFRLVEERGIYLFLAWRPDVTGGGGAEARRP
ncbi:MAG: GNAT family N-acetyltransferase [Bryobacteraceae bacterium]|nr:GNAT family N-acetyltransferase [Bryobacteraceae bacterium]